MKNKLIFYNSKDKEKNKGNIICTK